MMLNRRRILVAAGAGLGLSACSQMPRKPPAGEIAFLSAGPGSAFLPYAQGMAAYLQTRGSRVKVVETRGSIENLQRLDVEPASIGAVFMGTAFEAVQGSAAWTNGKKYTDLRALFPMYETSFQIVALRSTGLQSLAQLAGKRVGVGPAGGPAESFFKGLAEANGVQAQLVTGTPQALVTDLQGGKIDALWQGAALPIPAIKQVADSADAVVFGLTDAELAAMLARFPFLSPATISPGTYKGQAQPLKSIAAWNFVLANKAMPEADAYWLTSAVLSAADPLAIAPSAGPTRAANAIHNRALPFHPGALKYYAEKGIQGLK